MSPKTDGTSAVTLRPANADDEPILWRMLYLALFVAPGRPPYPPDVVLRPEIARYVRGWGREHDSGWVATDARSGEAIGAAWLRSWREGDRGFGWLDDATPELTIAVVPERRGRGVGTELLRPVLRSADECYAAVSLSVSLENPAQRLYRRFGFEAVETRGDSLTMRRPRGAPRTS